MRRHKFDSKSSSEEEEEDGKDGDSLRILILPGRGVDGAEGVDEGVTSECHVC